MKSTGIYKQISNSLKKLRHEKGWSLDKTAEKTGVSKAMLGQIEREESSPTIATLWKIATGFNTSFSSFIEEIGFEGTVDNLEKPLLRSGEAQQLHPYDEKIRVMILFPFDSELQFEIFRIELLPGCEHLSPPHNENVIEHVLVVEGSIELLVNGKWHLINKGEGFRFHANQPHGYRNLTQHFASIHDIIHYSKNSK